MKILKWTIDGNSGLLVVHCEGGRIETPCKGDFVRGKFILRKTTGDEHLVIKGKRFLLELSPDSIKQIQQWAGIGVEMPYEAITFSNGHYSIVRPTEIEANFPLMQYGVFNAVQIGLGVLLIIGSKRVYKINPETRTLEIHGPEDLITALRKGTLETAEVAA